MARRKLIAVLVASTVLLTATPTATALATETPVIADEISVDAPAPDRPMRAQPSAAPLIAETSRVNAAATPWSTLEIAPRADVVVHKVTLALLAPQGTTPNFTADDARKALRITDDFYNSETKGAIRFELEQLVDWTPVDEPIGCSDTGGLQHWISQRIGWEWQAARHLVVMVPSGTPCPGWANGEQGNDPDDGGRTFQPGADPSTLAHELGHNMSLAHAFSVQCTDGWDYIAEGSALPAGCSREEYGNRMDLMGGSWNFESFSAPSMARLGMLPNALQPACGAPRTATIESVGSGFDTQRALTWTDPQNSAVRYWAEYRDAADADRWDGVFSSPWALEPDRSGVQILRTNPQVPFGADILSRPADASDARQFIDAGESISLAHGMNVRVDSLSAATKQATVTVTVPCVEYTGDIAHLAAVSASYASDWAPVGNAIDADATSAWGTWPRAGEQTLDLAWPVAVTVDRVGVRFASDAADAANSGLIPARSWSIEAQDAAGNWIPVSGAEPAAAGRERDAVNTVRFAAVTTTHLRVRFVSWGEAWYTGSTGIADLEVFAAEPALPVNDVIGFAKTTLVAKKVVLTVAAHNRGTTTSSIVITTPYGSKTFPSVAPNVKVTAAFSTRKATIGAGSAQVVSSTTSSSTKTIDVGYSAR